jgi:DGQHR domain-containing protein
MPEAEYENFENDVRTFLTEYGFLDVSGGSKFKIGGFQVDACGGVDDYLLIVDATLTKSNVSRKITEMRGKLSQFKSFEVQNDGVELNQYKKYKEIILVVATKSIINDETHQKSVSYDPIVNVWDKQFFDYYRELRRLLKGYSRFQLLGELRVGYNKESVQKIAAMRLPSQSNSNIYSFFASPQDLLEICYVARRESGDEKYYQRLINPAKLNKIATYIRKGKSFANNIIVAIPEDISKRTHFKKENELHGIEFGELTIPKTYRSLWIIDGQHRLYGYSGVKPPLSPKDVLQVAAIENIGIEEQRELFIKINKEQSPVQTDLLWDLYSTAEPDNEKTGVLSRLAKYLDTLQQFHEKIYYPLRAPKKTRDQVSISKICMAIDDARLIKGTVKGNKKNPFFDTDFEKRIKKVAKGIDEFYRIMDNSFRSDPESSAFYNRVSLNSAGVHVMFNLYSTILSVLNGSGESFSGLCENYISLLHEFIIENYKEKKQIDEFLRGANSKEGKRERTDLLCEGINLKIGAKGLNLEKLPVSKKGEESKVNAIEKNLRSLVNSVMSGADIEWVKTRTPPGLYMRLKARASGESIPLNDLLTLGESIEIISRNDNIPLFEERIKKSFFSVDLFKALTVVLKDYRNTVIGHDRSMTKEKERQFQTMIPSIIEQMMSFLK